MPKNDESPFFTMAKPIHGQAEIPLGTAHVCQKCHNSYVCDLAVCHAGLNILCPDCGGSASHLRESAVAEQIRIARVEAEHRFQYLRWHHHDCSEPGCNERVDCGKGVHCDDTERKINCGNLHQMKLL